jgi:hypothetical protein
MYHACNVWCICIIAYVFDELSSSTERTGTATFVKATNDSCALTSAKLRIGQKIFIYKTDFRCEKELGQFYNIKNKIQCEHFSQPVIGFRPKLN